MKIKKPLAGIIISFLLLVPFRLPVSVLLIKFFNYVAQIEGTQLTFDILEANIVMTKIIYNIIFGTLFVYNIEMFSRKLLGRKATSTTSYAREQDESFYYWTILATILTISYLIFDTYWVIELFKIIYT